MNQSNITLEPTNRGRPTNPEVEINPELASGTIPQAWEHLGNWYYNFPGAVAEGRELLPTIEQWILYIEENSNFRKELPMNGFRLGNNGSYNIDGKGGGYNHNGKGGYYWSSSPSGTDGLNLYFYSETVWPSFADNRAYGFSVRCIKSEVK